MRLELASKMIREIVRSKMYRPTEHERRFVEGLEFDLHFSRDTVRDKDLIALRELYKKVTAEEAQWSTQSTLKQTA